MATADIERDNGIRARSIRLFSFLRGVEQFRSKRIHTLSQYSSTTPSGAVVWFDDMPDEPEVRTVLNGKLDPETETIVAVSRPRVPEYPSVPSELAGRIDNAESLDPDQQPELRPHPDSGEALPEDDELFLDWLVKWDAWVREKLRVQPIQRLYRKLFEVYEQVTQTPEDLEAIAAVGCLSWSPPDHKPTQRHMLTAPIEIDFDAESAVITATFSEGFVAEVEVDMLDPNRQPRPELRDQVAEQLDETRPNLFVRDGIESAIKSLTHVVGDEGHYDPEDMRPAAPAAAARVTFAPALIVRRRSNVRKLRVLDEIIAALEDEEQEVPDGVASIVEARDLDEGSRELDPGRDLDDTAMLLPLEANTGQRQIIWSVEHRHHTVVQGPPGTGKTHTIANTLAHLLATGRRVLITAHTERALKEVRDKLPEDLRDLVIAVTGQGRDEKAALAASIREMTSYSAGYQPTTAKRRIEELENGLDDLRREQASTRNELVQARTTEGSETTIGDYHGTAATIAQQLADQAEAFEWFSDDGLDRAIEITFEERIELLELLRSPEFDGTQIRSEQTLPDPGELPSPERFEQLVARAKETDSWREGLAKLRAHPAHASYTALDDNERTEVSRELMAVADDMRALQRRREPWCQAMVEDLAQGKPDTWVRRADELERVIQAADELSEQLRDVTVDLPENADLAALRSQGEGLREHLDAGKKLRRTFAPRPVKDAAEFLDEVKVNGAAPDTTERAGHAIDWIKRLQLLGQANDQWPGDTGADLAVGPTNQVSWHQAELRVLSEGLVISKRLTDLQDLFNRRRLVHPDWLDPGQIELHARVAGEPSLTAQVAAARVPIDELVEQLQAPEPDHAARPLRSAAQEWDAAGYAEEYARLTDLVETQTRMRRRDELLNRLRGQFPSLTAELELNPRDPVWDERLQQVVPASRWAWARDELRRRLRHDRTEELIDDLDALTAQIREQVRELTVERAWSHAVSRLTEQQQRNLSAYAALAKKSTGGKYRNRNLRNLQEALSRCRDAVPAWIMPINYVADVLDIDPNAFDVVIVDEASQAGSDATFLQYLAPKMIVIGDEHQVSPTAILDLSELHRLAEDHLRDFTDRALWEDPETSLFDHAEVRFGNRIILTEHFRCMPEIIGFSQRYVYEQNNVKLVPLRQYGSDRLPPVRTRHVSDGFRTPGGTAVNQPEVDAIVELIAKSVVDPAYETHDTGGLRKRTFGVISLTGSEQAKRIEKALIDRIGEAEYAERDIRCGDAADFQGSQRDVMFLSLVDAPQDGRERIRKRGDKGLYQRVNVAASRARDQMWLVHSVMPEQMDPEDIRCQLLSYCLAQQSRYGTQTGVVPEPVSDHEHDEEHFDSLFEQRIFNRIVDRGYVVQSQVPLAGRHIDLVVVGHASRLAVECDGDHWHGPDQWEKDLKRQQDLERAGMPFFRISDSAFYFDRDESLKPLWEELEQRGIYPAGREPSPPPAPTPSAERPQDAGTAPPPPRTTGTQASTPDVLEPDAELPQQTPDAGEDEGTLQSGDVASDVAVPDVAPMESSEAVDADTSSDVRVPAPAALEGRASEPGASDAALSLEPFVAWDTARPLPDPKDRQPGERLDDLCQILAVEGPILGGRLWQLYVKSAGRSRVGREYRRRLALTTKAAIGRGAIIADDPLDEQELESVTLHLPDQPGVLPRERGERALGDIPPAEVALMLAATRDDDEEAWFREVLHRYDLIRLTTAAEARLRQCVTLLP